MLLFYHTNHIKSNILGHFMIKVIKVWLALLNPSKLDVFIYFFELILFIFCGLFLPFSFASIINSASEQNFKLALLWTATHLLISILSQVITIIKNDLLYKNSHRIESHLKESSFQSISNIDKKFISDFIFTLDSLVVFICKSLFIVIISSYYKLFIGLFVLFGILTCQLISFLMQAKNKSDNEDKVITTIWSIITFFIIIFLIDLLSNNSISLTVFLVITSFVNSHVTKSELSFKSIRELLHLKKIILHKS